MKNFFKNAGKTLALLGVYAAVILVLNLIIAGLNLIYDGLGSIAVIIAAVILAYKIVSKKG